MTTAEPIAIVGSACRFPGDSDTPSKLWELLRSPRDLLRQVPPERYDADAYYHPDPKHHGTTNVRESYFLNEDPALFDTGFFNIPPGEAEAIDPQQGLLMETVYDSLCTAGQTIEGLRGSSTAVYVGVMCDDWSGVIAKDMEVFPQYGATGMARSIMSNRVSYFFDWHGPSMTIDTACSSSLVAVHQAVQTLRSGESKVAIAAGANLILTPGMYVAESKLSMLSPSGRSRMWDKDVDGYARGEGIAAVVLKPLSAAIRDNDHIEAVIRETGVNQDGRTPGLTMPSATAQAALIRDTYARAGLDINKPEDRPQFFHAHGTGTPAGDPQEAEAISRAFYSTDACDDKLYVGSIKTVIGHTEGTAGLASLIGTSLAMQHKVIPPNMHFNTLNPRIAQFYHHLEVPTNAYDWPELHAGQPRRASINSFGFGGTNAHLILDSYESQPSPNTDGPLLTPLTFSASSEVTLRSMLSDYLDYLRSNQQTSLHDLAYSLQTRRSTLPYRLAITASTAEDACSQLTAIISGEKESTVATRQLSVASPKILGVFTGQGSQWAQMGANLLQQSPFVAKRLSELDQALAGSSAGETPTWTLREMILASAESSRMAEAAISQPLCTAIQIVLVDLLKQAGIELHAVVGHSSGEIGAAYAAGLVTASDAIRIAYYRGLYAKLAKSPNGGKGSMMAVGTTYEDASSFCELELFQGRIQVAAQNSSSSITLSGDEDAIVEAVSIFKDEGKFARQLKVDTAYHSSHVLPCAKAYLAAMEKCGVERTTPTGAKWYSSVREGEIMRSGDLSSQYWVDNMTRSVLFSPAVAQAWADSGPFDLLLEVGPHPVLKTPCLDTLEEITGTRPPYSGLLGRGKDDVQEFSNALGFIWTHLGAGSVAFDNFARAASGSETIRRNLPDLPKYPFDHSRKFITLSRVSGLHNSLQAPPHPLLGKRCLDRETSRGTQWRNIISQKEIPWLHGHQIQGQIVFPATAYIAMAVEAIAILAGSSSIGLVSIEDLQIGRAMAFNDDASVETLFDVKIVSQTENEIEAQFSCNSGGPRDHKSTMALNASGIVKVKLASGGPDELPSVETDDLNTSPVEIDRFYNFLAGLGYNYSWPFHGTASIQRKADYATGTIKDQSGNEWEDQLIVHPGMLDTALQTTFAAFCCPGDERMWALHVPTRFKSIVINPHFTSLGVGKQDEFRYLSVAKDYKKGKCITELNLFMEEGCHTFLQIEGMELVPFSAALPENDAVLYSRFDYRLSNPDGELTAANYEFKAKDLQIAIDSERISFYYLRRLVESITAEEKANTLLHYRHLVDWAAHVVPQVMRGDNPHIPQQAKHDTESDIAALLKKHYERTDIRLLESVGENLPRAIRDRSNILEHMTKDGMLDDVYEEGFGLDLVNEYIAHMTSQIAHRYPQMNILEIGAGTGGSTRAILPRLGSAFSTYTYTDVSGGFFGTAQDRFKDYANRMIFKTFDMTQSPGSQGFVEGSYDVVIASNVLHATLGLEEMMNHVRSFLKPGGYVIILETVNNDCLRVGLPMGSLPGWWLGVETGRRWGPTLTLPQWDSLLRKCGFGGIDTTTPPVHKILPGHVFCAQALDERVEMLRSPLENVANLPATKAPQLAIIGGETLSVHRVAEQISTILAPRFPRVARFSSIEELNAQGLADSSTVLSLTELDDPLFATMTSRKLDAMKTLWRHSGNILWVTSGARAENPHSYMTLGVGRCMRYEYPNITLQVLDIDKTNSQTPGQIAEYLMRLELLDKWSKELRPGELLWSLEPEVYIQDDATIIPRLYPYEAGNKRYNTSRRVVTEQVNPQETKLLFATDEESWEVQRASPLHISAPLPFSTETRNVAITQFLLSAITVLPGCRLMLCVGIDTTSHEPLLAVTHTTESPATVPSSWTVPIGKANPEHVLGVVAADLVARSVLRLTNKGDTLVVHDPHPLVASALKAMADGESVALHITTSSQSNNQYGWQHVDKHLPERLVRWLLPSTTSKFIDLSQNTAESDTAKLIVRCLPRNCDVIDISRLLGTNTELRALVTKDDVSRELTLASSKIGTLTEQNDLPAKIPMIQLQDVSKSNAGGANFAIADCTSSSVTALVHPIDEGNIFRSDKTYFLVGLSGELGQSLCKWMVVHGARYIALTSRRPKVNDVFIRRMERFGATVKVLPMDITSRESLHACYETISKTMPSIAGVANGAMILEDALFDNMSYEAFAKVLSPKVLGSQLLDELFHDTPLDFFIFFSSTTAVMGNTGQSNYIAGNMYMNALAAQRKKRGVAASSIDISSVIGIGYVERAEDLSEDTFIKMGYKPMSEQDLQLLFAEAIVLGQPDSPEVCELATGVTPIYRDAQAKDQYLKDVKFSHFVMERQDTQGQTGKTASVPVRVQLAEVKTKADAVSIISESFLVRLRRILAITPDEAIEDKVSLVEQGVDSLMAVEVRSWFLKELDVDIPVLKILGGSSVTDLLNEALKLLPPSIVDLTALEPGQASQKAKAQVVPPTQPTTESRGRASSSSQGSTTGDSQNKSTPGYSTPAGTGINTPMTSMNLSTASLAFTHEKFAKATECTDDSSISDQPSDESSSPMSFGQAGFWFLNEYLSNKKAFNMAAMLKLTGPIRIKPLEDAVRTIGNRHEILRTRFYWSGEGDERIPMQGVRPSSAMKLTTKRISSEAEAEAELDAVHDEAWDLSSGDAVKISLLSVSDQEHFLLLGMHHIFLDGYSFSIFFKDLEAAYNKKILPRLASECQYRNFATQQRQVYEKGGLNEMIEHYRKTIPANPEPIPLLPFANSATRQGMNNYSQHKASVRIEAKLATKLRQLARRNRSTSFHVYLSALQALMFRLLPDTDDIFIGIADANRQDKTFMGSIGFFLNLLPLHFRRREPRTSLASIIQTARDTAYGALQYSQLPFDVLLRELNVPRSNAYTPLLQIFMDYRQVVQERSTWGGCKLHGESWRNASTGYDIALEVTENVNTDTLLSLRLQDTLYSEESTQLLLRSYVHVLEFMIDANEGTIDDIPSWSPHDIQSALTAGKAIEHEPKWQRTIAHRIDDMIKDNGSKVALKDGNGAALTYEQMGARVDSIAATLLAFGVTKQTVVGVFQEPCADWICSMLAIFKTGAIYVPLDLRNSIPRLHTIVKAAQPTFILSDTTTTAKIQLIGAGDATEVLVSGLPQLKNQQAPQPNQAEADAQAVILFTSGSTGEPKGLRMTHTNIVAFAEVSSRTFADNDDNLVVLQQSPFSFDFSLDQTFAALANGGCLYVVPARNRGDPVEISKIMVEENVTYTTATPSEYDMWLRYGSDNLSQCNTWKYAFSGGEAMSHRLAREFGHLKLAQLHLFNGYGPAETTILSTKTELKYSEPGLPDPLPAGYMLPGFSVCIVDTNLQPLPLGVPGEIVIGGPCVLSGYLANPVSTKQKFIPDVFFGKSSKVYRSGDRGRLLADGKLFCDGRLEGDTQVKLRGFRVELMEVENALVRHAAGALSHAVVTLRGSGEGRYLAAHVVFSTEFPEERRTEVIKTLRHSLPLPPYMRPSIIATLPDIPRTSHLKVDRKTIQAMPLPQPEADADISENLSGTERELAELWCEVLPVHPGPLTAESDFFLVGGNSILLVRLQSMARDSFLAAPKLATLMGSSTLGAMATAIDASRLSNTIDWETETQLPHDLRQIVPTKRPTKTNEMTILLTGSAGYLGRHLLAELDKNPKVTQIIALLRNVDDSKLQSSSAKKVTVMQADISQPKLSLSDENFTKVVEKTDIIVHCAANRSFWDTYEVLRPDNFDSVKELTRLATHHAIPLHVMSSGAVARYDGASTCPPKDGSDGYTSTKWAAEKFLHQAAAALDIPVHIHRPMATRTPESGEPAVQATVLGQLTSIVRKLGIRPSFDGVSGSVDVMPVSNIVAAIHNAVISSSVPVPDEGSDSVKILRHEAALRVFVEDFAAHLRKDDFLRSRPTLPILEWFGKAKKTGFGFVMTAQNLVMSSADGELISQR